MNLPHAKGVCTPYDGTHIEISQRVLYGNLKTRPALIESGNDILMRHVLKLIEHVPSIHIFPLYANPRRVYDEQKKSESKMEYKKPREITSELLRARDQLRSHLELETALIARTAELPEEDFCHDARHSFQLGAGCAYLKQHEEMTLDDVFAVYFDTQPQNRYIEREVIELERKRIAEAALNLLDNCEMPKTEDGIDPFQTESSAAFVEGYLLTVSLLNS